MNMYNAEAVKVANMLLASLLASLLVLNSEQTKVFTVRRSALHGLCDSNSVCLVCPSVRPSVCQSHSWTVSTWFDLRS